MGLLLRDSLYEETTLILLRTYSDEDREQWINALTVQNLMSFEEEEDSTLTWGMRHYDIVWILVYCGY